MTGSSSSSSSSSSSEEEEDRRKRKSKRKHKSRKREVDSDESSDDESRERRKKHKSKKRKHKRKRRKRYSSSSSSDDSSSSSSEKRKKAPKTKKVMNERLLQKLSARGETLEEREERRGKRRADQIQAKFGYTNEDNPFHDPNLHEQFQWKKKQDPDDKVSRKDKLGQVFSEIEKVRNRRKERLEEQDEIERKKAEQARLREQENFHEWERKEEEFHLLQQRQRSAIRLVQGREKPIDVLAKNLLMFGLTDKDSSSAAVVKYKEKYTAWNDLKHLDAELLEPHFLLKDLKLDELKELLSDINDFRRLEKESESSDFVLLYWENLYVVTADEIKKLEGNCSNGNSNKIIAKDVDKLFEKKSIKALEKMREEIISKLRNASSVHYDGGVDTDYWHAVLEQLNVHLAKAQLSELHSRMLVHQLEVLETRRAELAKVEKKESSETKTEKENEILNQPQEQKEETKVPKGVDPTIGDADEDLGLANEVSISKKSYTWNDGNIRSRKPRYFNRVKTGYDWNKYNQTHYDHQNPPPKVVQGYKFNIFYPELLDKTKTPRYFLESAGDSNDFCIIRFSAGAPYEDVAFKIINREWNKSRKRGFRCTFERGILSLYFNFTTYHYRK